METDRAEALRAIPQVDRLLREVPGLDTLGDTVAGWLVRREIEAARARVLAGGDAGDVVAQVARARDALERRRIRRVINATGVVLHTNLGRAQLSDAAVDAVAEAARAAALEYDVDSGERAARAPVSSILAAALCDAEDALVVNNNAGALLLALGALARGGEVLVGRGELIEIGGSFRLPEVMEAGGAILREVGTTNRTRLQDYRAALTDATRMILKVHPSNFEVIGFTEAPALADLVGVSRAAGVPLLFDIGSGLLRPEEGVLSDEPDAASALAAGCDLVCFSGDKLLGGPQAGILAGRADLIETLKKHPIARAVRADKLTLAALEATLWAHARGQRSSIPTRRMLETPVADIEARARALASGIEGARVIDGDSVTGGGSLPGRSIPTPVVALTLDRPQRLAAVLRHSDPPVIARVERDRLVIDLRTVDPSDDALVRDALRRARGR